MPRRWHSARLIKRTLKVLVILGVLALGNIHTGIAFAPTANAQQNPPPPPEPPPIPDSILSNCYAYVRSQIPSLPLANKIVTNTTPHVGAVAFFDYDGEPHYAIIVKLTAEGFWVTDSNFGGPGIRTHYIGWDNPHIRGFWAHDSS